MEYPEDFVDRVKAVFPDSRMVHDALDDGHSYVGEFLLSHVNDSVSPERIIELLDEGDVDLLRFEAEQCQKVGPLYDEWCGLPD